MPKKVACPGCSASYNIPDNMPRRNVTCRQCKASFEVGGEEPAAANPFAFSAAPAKAKPQPAPVEAPQNEEASAPAAKDPADSKFRKVLDTGKQALTGEKRHVWFSVIGGGALALMLMSCILCGGSFWLFRSVTGSSSFAKQDDTEDPGLPPVDKSDIEPAAIPPNATGQLNPEIRDRLKQSTVFIRVTDSDGDTSSGSGFFGAGIAGPDIVMTNAHVVGMLEPDSKKPPKIEIILNSGERNEVKMPGEVLGVDRISDLALLRALPSATQRDRLPKPLDVKTSKRLFETQRLFVVGFPLGEQLGKEITFSDSSVGSLRKDENGHLNRVQVNGGMHPGNSGGPVIDLAGNIVGVAVSVIRGTTINFAIPGDHVHTIMNGKIENAVIDQPYLKDGKSTAHCTLYKIDPLKRIRQSALMVWTAPAGTPRPPAFEAPGAQAGDSAHQKIVLRTKDENTVQGDITLPPLPPGQVYWGQPYWVNGRGEPRWAAGVPYELSPPVERKPAQLVMKHSNGQRLVNLNQKSTLKLNGASSADKLRIVTTDTSLMEITRSVDNQGTADNRWEYKTFKISAKEGDEQLPPDVQRDMQTLMQNMPLVTATQRVSKQNVASPTVADLNRVPPQNRADVVKLHDEVRQALEALSVTMPPNPAVAPLQTWKTTRTVPMRSLGGGGGAAQMETTYTFMGTRTVDGRQEAVIGIKGALHGPPGNEAFSLSGRSDGTAVFDVAAGQFSSANLTNVVDVNVHFGRGSIKINGTVESKMQRQVK